MRRLRFWHSSVSIYRVQYLSVKEAFQLAFNSVYILNRQYFLPFYSFTRNHGTFDIGEFKDILYKNMYIESTHPLPAEPIPYGDELFVLRKYKPGLTVSESIPMYDISFFEQAP